MGKAADASVLRRNLPKHTPTTLLRSFEGYIPHIHPCSKDQRLHGGAFHMTAGTCQRSPKRGLRVGGGPTKRDGGSARKGGPPLS
jgi:hypothetical protein